MPRVRALDGMGDAVKRLLSGLFPPSEDALAERAAIVKWLRSRKDRLGQPSGKALRLADKIEKGEHHTE